MAAQDERESGVLGSCSVVGRPMVQDIPEQDIVVQVELPPQMDPKREMGAAAAAADFATPPILRQIPPLSPAKMHTIMADRGS